MKSNIILAILLTLAAVLFVGICINEHKKPEAIELPAYGEYMPSILDLQVACNQRGWKPRLKEDGVYGDKTKEAIEYYNGNDMAKEWFDPASYEAKE